MRLGPRSSGVAAALAVLGMGAAAAAAPTTSRPLGKDGDVAFTEPVVVGITVLAPGHYRFRHVLVEGRHYLIIRRQQTATWASGSGATEHWGQGKGAEIARVVCDVFPLAARVEQTEVYTHTRADGTEAVTQIRIKGESASHLLPLDAER